MNVQFQCVMVFFPIHHPFVTIKMVHAQNQEHVHVVLVIQDQIVPFQYVMVNMQLIQPMFVQERVLVWHIINALARPITQDLHVNLPHVMEFHPTPQVLVVETVHAQELIAVAVSMVMEILNVTCLNVRTFWPNPPMFVVERVNAMEWTSVSATWDTMDLIANIQPVMVLPQIILLSVTPMVLAVLMKLVLASMVRMARIVTLSSVITFSLMIVLPVAVMVNVKVLILVIVTLISLVPNVNIRLLVEFPSHLMLPLILPKKLSPQR